MKEVRHRLYIIEDNNIPDTEIDYNISSDMYNKEYYGEGDITDLDQDGWLNLATGKYFFDFPCDVNKNNITVLKNAYEKLAYIVFCLTYYSYTREDIDIVTKDIVTDLNEKNYCPGFRGFTFDTIKEVNIEGSSYYIPIDYKEDDELIFCFLAMLFGGK